MGAAQRVLIQRLERRCTTCCSPESCCLPLPCVFHLYFISRGEISPGERSHSLLSGSFTIQAQIHSSLCSPPPAPRSSISHPSQAPFASAVSSSLDLRFPLPILREPGSARCWGRCHGQSHRQSLLPTERTASLSPSSRGNACSLKDTTKPVI